MNGKRLYRSSDAVFGGVCGGIAEYFGIDPTLVRIIAVALTIVGFGLPALAYVVLMVVLPPDPAIAQGYVDTRAEATPSSEYRTSASASAGVPPGAPASWPAADAESTACSGFAAEPPPPDPATRVSSPVSSAAPASQAAPAYASSASSSAGTGTCSTGSGSAARGVPGAGFNVAEAVRSHSSAVLIVGAVLIGVGVIALLCNFVHVSVWRFWPLVLVVVGVICLFTPGSHGWSLARAGNAIVLITLGLVLLAWMLRIVHTWVFVAAFRDLWPVLLVVAGLAIIGNARKSSVVCLLSSLVLSATILLGLWFYGGLDWDILGATALVIESDGLHEFFSEVSLVSQAG
ncbi:MAG: PspC domain-containing protein [Coriobacteriales bacterium]|jgi:phage shock protein C|nr:PspC domain-containing protein [Coriobacteriales bacterium]